MSTVSRVVRLRSEGEFLKQQLSRKTNTGKRPFADDLLVSSFGAKLRQWKSKVGA